MRKTIFVLISLSSSFALAQYTGKTGINTTTPTETLHVNGTERISSLPIHTAANSIYTKPDGTASAAKDQTFTATRTVVADNNGVLGYVNGLPANNSAASNLVYTTASPYQIPSFGTYIEGTNGATVRLPVSSSHGDQVVVCALNSAGAKTSILIDGGGKSIIVPGGGPQASMGLSNTDTSSCRTFSYDSASGGRWWLTGM